MTWARHEIFIHFWSKSFSGRFVVHLGEGGNLLLKVGKILSVYATETWGSGGIAPFVLNLGTSWR